MLDHSHRAYDELLTIGDIIFALPAASRAYYGDTENLDPDADRGQSDSEE
jgi:hypothetical protein